MFSSFFLSSPLENLRKHWGIASIGLQRYFCYIQIWDLRWEGLGSHVEGLIVWLTWGNGLFANVLE